VLVVEQLSIVAHCSFQPTRQHPRLEHLPFNCSDPTCVVNTAPASVYQMEISGVYAMKDTRAHTVTKVRPPMHLAIFI